MKSVWKYIVAQQGLFYKSLLILSSSVLILYIFPLGGQFKYEFQKGRVWQYPDFYSPFDFSILKSEAEVKKDEATALKNLKLYLRADETIKNQVYSKYAEAFIGFFQDQQNPMVLDSLYDFGKQLLDEVYFYGVLPPNYVHQGNPEILLIQGQTEIPILVNKFFKPEKLFEFIGSRIVSSSYVPFEDMYKDLFFELIVPNVSLDKNFYETAKAQVLQNISRSRGFIPSGKLIVAEGALVDEETFEILNSLRKEFTLQQEGQSSYWVLFGYSILIVLTFTLLLLFLNIYRFSIYEDNRKLTFIFFNILVVIISVTLTINYNTNYVFAVPICILPLIIKAFFDARLGLFIHLLTVLLLGFIVPNSFEFVFLQITAGIVTIQSVAQLYRRANLFISVGQIVLVYLTGYVAFTTIQEGNLLQINFAPMGLFMLNGLLMLFVQPLIYIYERIFGLVSDVSLLELSDTNSNLLKELSDKAPGTFHHSLQVANLAEAAANEIGANTLLVRVGALYHDIGKLKSPMYFSENQTGTLSPHEELTPKQSAEIIINHVLDGVAIAQKNKIPDRIIDFIRTHHGTSTVYYFYKKQEELTPDKVNIEDFRYLGPKPFSKETAILMMADAVEAASKSLKEPNINELQAFIDKIIDGKMAAQQFNSSDITFSEIETIKKVLFKKLVNVYQLRIEYPE
ncbi:HDIG domain-containing protein [Flavobacteriaceae bacterium]|nr:HDIG domain-containing protein [Flavobacteriaceae bacterium]MDA9851820.1 HDIG domain-containing protein [Flavobacteriaceae bacterium]